MLKIVLYKNTNRVTSGKPCKYGCLNIFEVVCECMSACSYLSQIVCFVSICWWVSVYVWMDGWMGSMDDKGMNGSVFPRVWVYLYACMQANIISITAGKIYITNF